MVSYGIFYCNIHCSRKRNKPICIVLYCNSKSTKTTNSVTNFTVLCIGALPILTSFLCNIERNSSGLDYCTKRVILRRPSIQQSLRQFVILYIMIIVFSSGQIHATLTDSHFFFACFSKKAKVIEASCLRLGTLQGISFEKVWVGVC